MAGNVIGAALGREARARQIVCDCGTPVCFGCEYCHEQGCEDYMPPGVFDKCTHHLGGFEDPDELEEPVRRPVCSAPAPLALAA